MNLNAFPFKRTNCPRCSSPVPSAVVYTITGPYRGVNYVLHDCALCGHVVHRVIGFDIVNPQGSHTALAEAVKSQAEIEAVVSAAKASRSRECLNAGSDFEFPHQGGVPQRVGDE
jgi:hypothetical protein